MFDFKNEPGKKRKERFDSNLMKDSPLVSIITAYYNADEYFEQTFNCVMNQTFPWFEWIIVDDGSTKKEAIDSLEKFVNQDSRIYSHRQENAGAVQARNFGIEVSKTNIIIFLDADDLIDPRYLEETYWALLLNKNAKWAYTDSVGFGNTEYEWEKEFLSSVMKKENILSYIAAFRKEIFLEEKNLYDPKSKNHWEDWQLWLKLLAKGYYGIHIKQKFFWYRRLDSGMLSKIDKDIELKNQLQKKIETLAKDVPEDIRSSTFDNIRATQFAKPKDWEWKRVLPYKKKKINILLMLPHMECGGADKFNLDIIRKLDHEKYEIGIVTTVEDENEWKHEFEKYVDDIFELPKFVHLDDWYSFISYYVYSREVDIVWNISSYWSYYILPILKIKYPKLAILDCIHNESEFWRAGGYPRISAKLDFILDKTYVTNDYTKNILVNKYDKTKELCQVIYTGIDVEDFKNIEVTDEYQKYDIDPKKKTILYLCRIVPEKRPFLFMEIMKKMNKILPNVQALIVGGGPQLDEVRNYAKNEGIENLIFTGRVDDMRPFYKIADCFLLCSLKEGLSITTFESLLMGIPVVSSNVGGQYELVTEETGYLVECLQNAETDFDNRNFKKEEIEDYCDKLYKILSDDEKHTQMSRSCIEKINNGFTLSDLIDTLDRDFTDLMQEEKVIKRIEKSKMLEKFELYFNEMYTVYQLFESKEKESKEIWDAREWFRIQLDECKNAKMELETMKSLKSWKMIQKYYKFMNENIFGKICKKILFRRSRRNINEEF